MTKKLSKYEKDKNKTRRSALLYVRKLLKDKSIVVGFNLENMVARSEPYESKIFFTGQRKITLDWWEKVK